MRKYLCFILLASLLIAYGCQGVEAPAQNAVTAVEVAEPKTIETLEGDGENAMVFAPEGGEMPADMPTGAMRLEGKIVMGRVKSIFGNSVELELAKTDEDQMQRFTFQRGPDMTPDPSRTIDPNRTPNPNRQSGGQGEGGPQFFISDDGQQPAQGGQRIMRGGGQALDFELEYTGETAQYIIPVGMQVGMGDYTSITVGSVLRLILDDEDEIIAVMMFSA